jgi:hypothetical protein
MCVEPGKPDFQPPDVGLSYSGAAERCSSLLVSCSLHVLQRLDITCTSRSSIVSLTRDCQRFGSTSTQAKTGNHPLDPPFRSSPPRRGRLSERRTSTRPGRFTGRATVMSTGQRLQAAQMPEPNRDLSGFSDPFNDVRHEVRHAPRPDGRYANSRACLTRHLPLSMFLTSSGVYTFESFASFFHDATAHRISITGLDGNTLRMPTRNKGTCIAKQVSRAHG